MKTDLCLVSILSFIFTASIPFVISYDFTNIPSSEVSHNAQQLSSSLDSILYSVSSLGLPDPFSHYSTHLTYDSKVEIGDPHNNQKGSILTVLNGTIYPLGSVGGIGGMGWEGNSNDTDINQGESSSNKTREGSIKTTSNGAMSGEFVMSDSQHKFVECSL